MKVAIIGGGTIAHRHLTELEKAGASISGLYSRSEITRAEIKKKYGIAVFDSPEKLLESTKPDAVVVASPNYLHAEHTKLALNSDCHVLCEKPMAMNLIEAKEMHALADKKNKALMLAQNLRFFPQSYAARHLLANQFCGHVFHVRCQWIRNRGVPGLGSWFTQKKYSGGGALIDIGIHLLDLAWYLLEKPEPLSVSGQTYCISSDDKTKMDVEDFCSAEVKFKTNQTIQMEVAWAANQLQTECRIEFYGDKGGMTWSKSKGLTLFDGNGRESEHEVINENIPGSRPVSMHSHFMQIVGNKIDHRSKCMVPSSDGLVTQRLLDSIYEAASKEQSIRL